MKPEFYIGTSGWSYNHWKGSFYPDKLPQRNRLPFYAENFNTVEVNMTFYRFPSESAVSIWAERTPDNFIFTFKAPRIITHIRRLAGIEEHLNRIYELLDLAGGKGKSLLFQMPPSFHLSSGNISRIENLLKLLDDRYDHIIEFRESSWWCEEVYDLLRNRCTFCSVNGLDMPRDIVLTGDIIYLRFHGGHYNLRYSRDELHDYSEKINELVCEKRIRKFYIYFNNDYSGYAVNNAMELREMIKGII